MGAGHLIWANSYPFKISMDHPEAMHVRQAARNVNQLERTSVKPWYGWGSTYKLSTVHVFVLLDKLIDVPMFHPLGDHRKPALAYRHSKQWQDIGVTEVFPGDPLPAESL